MSEYFFGPSFWHYSHEHTPETESIPQILDRQREEQEYLARFRAHRETFRAMMNEAARLACEDPTTARHYARGVRDALVWVIGGGEKPKL